MLVRLGGHPQAISLTAPLLESQSLAELEADIMNPNPNRNPTPNPNPNPNPNF